MFTIFKRFLEVLTPGHALESKGEEDFQLKVFQNKWHPVIKWNESKTHFINR